MAKAVSQFVCQTCGAIRSRWAGKCDVCGDWNSYVETTAEVTNTPASKGHTLSGLAKKPVKQPRISTGIPDIDTVLGGGISQGSIVLISGEPGIGKSTLLTQLAIGIKADKSVLYISAEESAEQVGARALRLGAKSDIPIVSSTSTEDIAATIASGDFGLIIVDSMQTIGLMSVPSAPGSISQVTNSTHALIRAARTSNTALILVGHITKEGSIAGPKLLEHLVDVVMTIEGDRYGGFKVVRCAKNRFGPTNEASILEMGEQGLSVVENPSKALLEERVRTDGSVILATLEGNRPVLVEIQALVNKSNFGYPKRTASGFDLNRLNLLVAVLNQRTKLDLSESDIYVNVVGGIAVKDSGADLAVAMAVASAARGLKLKDDAVVFGEIGLSGEVRHVQQAEKRTSEALKMGFTTVLGPRIRGKLPKGLSVVSDLKTALNTYLSKD
jgi:DNA repair protein RadA/Sms